MFASELDDIDVQDVLRGAVDAVAATDRGDLDVVALRREIDRLECAWRRAVQAMDRSGEPRRTASCRPSRGCANDAGWITAAGADRS